MIIGSYQNFSSKYIITEADRKGAFTRQYFEIYEARLQELKTRILENAELLIGKEKFRCLPLSDVNENEEVLVIGIIVKRLKNRPSILKSLLNEEKVTYDNYENEDDEELKRYAGSDDDKIDFESDKQTVRLEGNISFEECATGCCVGVLGSLGKEGIFHVKQLIWPLPIISPLPKMDSNRSTIAFISGLELTGNFEADKYTISAFELMTEWLKGNVGTNSDESKVQQNVQRVVILGPSINNNQNGCNVQDVVRTLALSRQERQLSTKALTILDKLITSLSNDIQIDLVPGVGDPCSSMYPQPPIHRVCLPRAGLCSKKTNLVTNPYEFNLDDVDIGVTSGENVTDLLRTSVSWTGCDVLENLVKWQHLAPSCPDSLDGFPMASRDPLIINKTPHILIAGNQQTAEIRRVKVGNSENECLAICLPKFSKTFTMCLLDLSDFQLSWRMFDHQF